MCSCARRILLVATICIARVIFWVLRMLGIFARISLVPAMSLLVWVPRGRAAPCRSRLSIAPRPRELLADVLEPLLELRREIRVRIDRLEQVGMRGAREVLQRGLERLD